MIGNDRGRRWPDVYIVGAGRSGTTALHQILRTHPELRVCDHKSPNFFVSAMEQPAWETSAARRMAQDWISDPASYLNLFSGARPDQMLLEVSPVYLQARGVAAAINSVNSEAKIVAVLRDPADRAFAHFLGRKRDGIETARSFEEWMGRMRGMPLPQDVAFGHYTACGQYRHFLDEYLEVFGRKRVLVLFYEDLVADPHSVVARILEFTGVDSSTELNVDVRANESGEISSRVLKSLWTSTVGVRTHLRPFIPQGVRRSTGRIFLSDLRKSTLEPHLRREIIDMLEHDIRSLASTASRDLSSWLV